MTDPAKQALDQMIRSMVKPEPLALYHQLGQLRNEMPHWKVLGTPAASKWTGRVIAIVEAAGGGIPNEIVTLRTYVDHIHRHGSTEQWADVITQIIETVLAQLELKLPTESQGAFIPAGGVYDGYQA